MRHKRASEPENHDRWLVSYADFITLLFAFFVVMFVSTQSNKLKAKEVSESVREPLEHGQFSAAISTVLGRGKHENSRPPTNPDRVDHSENLAPKPAPPQQPADLAKSLDRLQNGLGAELKAGKIGLKLEGRGLIISLDRKSTRLNSSHLGTSYAVFFLKKQIEATDAVAGPLDASMPHRLGLLCGIPVAVATAVTASARVAGGPCVLSLFFNDTATTEIYTLSLHDALPVCLAASPSTERDRSVRKSLRSNQRRRQLLGTYRYLGGTSGSPPERIAFRAASQQ